MELALQMAAVALGTTVLFFGCAPLLARSLRLKDGSDGVQAQLAAMTVRLLLAALLALGFALSGLEHRVALVFTVGAAYFAAALVDGARHFLRRSGGAPTGSVTATDAQARPGSPGEGRELHR